MEYCPCLIKDCGHEQPDPNAIRQLCQPVAVISAVAGSSATSAANKRPGTELDAESTEPKQIGAIRKSDKASILARNQRKQQLRDAKERRGESVSLSNHTNSNRTQSYFNLSQLYPHTAELKAKEKSERKAEKLAARQLAKVQEAERRAARKAKKRSVVTGGGANASSSGLGDDRNGSKKARNMSEKESHHHDDEGLQSDGYSTASTDATDDHPELGFANADGIMRVRKLHRKQKIIQSPSSSSSSSTDGTTTDISKDETVQPR